ncbi:type III-A CRISPR-associated RAMP protein Csm5 [Desulfurobacterium atlanticum]|uniref:CRISPR system Cms protein Csm5 n=1 Tax=Desulfurobacterium atlanticum TaxID=240169 RepID=A0A238Y4X8_9BACT|nr:type III-A CRISPR-associated RAMP protein Csm5 [Desulfurobacterium atlanticum]SNR65868.1 CRISPR-associated protein, Csm5 family [Desulfurobacterium atlanticum]
METYKIRLKVETPAHIGTGEEHYATDFAIKDGKFYLIDHNKFFNHLEKLGKVDEFIEIATSDNPSSILKIRKLIKETFKPEFAKAEIEIDETVAKEIEKKYTEVSKVEVSRREVNKVINRLSIKKVYKCPLTFKPVVPGSSLKGAIRTAIISYILKNKKENNPGLTAFLTKNIKLLDDKTILDFKVDENLSNPKTARDPFRFIKVSDFNPIDTGVKIGKSQMYHIKKGSLNLPVYLEYVKEGSTFEGEIKIDRDMAEKIFKDTGFPFEILEIENLLKQIRIHFGNYVYYKKEKERNLKFSKWKLRANKHKMEAPLKIGFHSGAYATTVADDELRQVYDRKRKTTKPDPLTFWMINQKPMGWCYLEVIE